MGMKLSDRLRKAVGQPDGIGAKGAWSRKGYYKLNHQG
jgi:hypothetical protein